MMPGPTSARTALTSRGEQTIARAPASTARAESRSTASCTLPVTPVWASWSSLREVSTVTAAIFVPGAFSAAARMTSAPPLACTVSRSGCSRATVRAAAATVAGMSYSFRSRKTRTPLAPLIEATTFGPYRRYNSSPIFTVLTCGVTRPAQRAAVSRSGASSATATGAGLLKATPSIVPGRSGVICSAWHPSRPGRGVPDHAPAAGAAPARRPRHLVNAHTAHIAVPVQNGRCWPWPHHGGAIGS